MLAIYCRPRFGNGNIVDSIQPATDFWQSAIQKWRGKAYNTPGPWQMADILAGSFFGRILHYNKIPT